MSGLDLKAWKADLQKTQGGAVNAIFAHANVLAGFHTACEVAGSYGTFGKSLKSWLGYDKATASKWKLIADKCAELSLIGDRLPANFQTIALLASMAPEDREAVARVDLTRAEVLETKRAKKAAVRSESGLIPGSTSVTERNEEGGVDKSGISGNVRQSDVVDVESREVRTSTTEPEDMPYGPYPGVPKKVLRRFDAAVASIVSARDEAKAAGIFDATDIIKDALLFLK